jgi:acyl carrier protein
LSQANILERLQPIFRDVFDDDDITVGPETTAEDVEGWDSLMHVSLMINIERAFGVRFSTTEVASMTNVGELARLLEQRIAGGGRA